ncbi:flagellar assembly protein FlgT [Rheinheimera muenzenbergensis]|uniref:Flagellar assembly protein FlgT n=1 Tax=Rheinheimera muenzenbergensis TaxID=1193628 RepID=A0ABU8C2P7_9GAMM
MKKYSLSMILLLVFSQTGFATWYEVSGQAAVERGNLVQAREAAINDALKRAALFSGASFSASQQLVNGILQNEQYQLDSHSEIQQVQLLSETKSQNMLTVTLRAEILPLQRHCQSNNYRKTLLLSPFKLLPRQDAIHGNLFNLPRDATQQLDKQLRDYSPVAMVSAIATHISLAQLNHQLTQQLFSEGSQYLLTAQITDLSMGNTTNSFWQDASKERFFALDVTLYDLFEQQIVFQQEYRTAAPWPYKEPNTPDSHSQAFWNMPYGSKIATILHAVAEDVQQHLRCQPLLSQVSQVQQQQLTLNMGAAQGLKVGDTLEIIQIQRHPSQPEIRQLLHSPIRLTVQNVNQHRSWAIPQQQQLVSHIQAGDLVTIAPR